MVKFKKKMMIMTMMTMRGDGPAGRRKNMIPSVANIQVASFPDIFHDDDDDDMMT